MADPTAPEESTDVMDRLANGLQRLLIRPPKLLVSPAPAPSLMPQGERRVLGFPNRQIGGLERDTETDAELREAVQRALESSAHTRIRKPPRVEDARLMRAYSPELHSNDQTNRVCGPWSLFDGTQAAPSAGNSLVGVPVTLPTNAVSPVLLLNRYPGAMYVVLHIHSIAFQPTGTTMTGLQELYFQDVGGAVVGLGIYNPAVATASSYNGIDRRCTSPYTDPGTIQLGFLFVNNIGIGGTPVSSRWQIEIGYVAMYPDPRYGDLMVEPPTPFEETMNARRMAELSTIGAGRRTMAPSVGA